MIAQRIVTRAGVSLAALAIGLGLAATAAISPATAQTSEAQTIEAGVDGLIAVNPGAVQVSPNTVRLVNGVEATLTKSAPRPAAGSGSLSPQGRGCEYLHTCIWSQADYEWSFYHCGFVNIGLSGWSDQLRESENNQTKGTGTVFYNWTGSSWEFLGGNTAYFDTGYIVFGTKFASLMRTDAIDVCNNASPR